MKDQSTHELLTEYDSWKKRILEAEVDISPRAFLETLRLQEASDTVAAIEERIGRMVDATSPEVLRPAFLDIQGLLHGTR